MEECSQRKVDNYFSVEGNDAQQIGDRSSAEDEVKLESGMVFESFDKFFQYYRSYGNKMGFEISIRSSRKGDDGELIYANVACCCGGKRDSNSRNVFKLHPLTKSGCKARSTVSRRLDGKWEIVSIIYEHNHELITPSKTRFFKSNRFIQAHVKRKLEVNDRVGIRPSKNFNSLVVEARGVENLSFLQKDCRNYIEKIRRIRLGDGDASALQKYFPKMQKDNPNFFYIMDLDEDGRLQNVLWVDARSRAAFKEFGDVVTFDTTYLTNKYDMPFAAFVGVNHHGQSTLLGCGLISHEDTKTFVWLFESWLACMWNFAPKAIITDQDKAMQNAIEIVFPDTRHRWCLWHIMKKLPEKLRGYKEYEHIKFTLQNVVYDSLTCEEFEERWNWFIEKYNLHDNDWLFGLYNERYRWVPTFVKDTFWAGMSTTQRSESMNAFFDGYVNSKTTLKQFVKQYENALRDKAEKENEADFKSIKSWIPCISIYPMEKQFQDAYTVAKFKEFQNELAGKLHCEICSLKDMESKIEYVVKEDVIVGETYRRVPFVVWFEKRCSEVRCNCRLFEFRGILCRHAIAVLIHNEISLISESYILRRWRKNIFRCHTKVRVSYNSWSTSAEGERFDQLSNSFSEVADLASTNVDDCNMVMQMISDINKKLLNDNIEGIDKSIYVASKSKINSNSVDCTAVEVNNKIITPRVVHSKGRPPFKRKQSKVEQIVRKGKKLLNQGRSSQESNEVFVNDITVHNHDVGVHVLSQGYNEIGETSLGDA